MASKVSERKEAAKGDILPFLYYTNVNQYIGQENIPLLVERELEAFNAYQLSKIIQMLSYSLGAFDYWIGGNKPVHPDSEWYIVQQKVIDIIEKSQSELVGRIAELSTSSIE